MGARGEMRHRAGVLRGEALLSRWGVLPVTLTRPAAAILLMCAVGCGGPAPSTATDQCDARTFLCPSGNRVMSDCGACRTAAECSAGSVCVEGACFRCPP